MKINHNNFISILSKSIAKAFKLSIEEAEKFENGLKNEFVKKELPNQEMKRIKIQEKNLPECEWTGDTISFCGKMIESIGKYEYRDNLARGILNGASVTCNFCGTDLTYHEPEPELTTGQKSDILIKEMSKLGISAHDFISNFITEPETEDMMIACPNCYCANDPLRITCSECGGKLFHE